MEDQATTQTESISEDVPQPNLTLEEKSKLKNALGDVLPELKARQKIQNDVLFTDSDGATITFNIDNSSLHTVTLGGNRTLAISGGKLGQVFIIRLVQDNSGNRSVTWFPTIKWSGSAAPVLTSSGNAIDTFGFIIIAINAATGAITYDGYVIGQNVG